MYMDRTEFLQMCQKCSVLADGICGIKKNVPPDLIIYHDNMPYYPIAYKLSFDKHGNTIHTAILHDLCANSIICADLNRVDKNKNL